MYSFYDTIDRLRDICRTLDSIITVIPVNQLMKRKRKSTWMKSRIKSTRAVREKKPLIDSRMLPRSLIWKTQKSVRNKESHSTK